MTKVKFLVVYCLFISGLCCMANVTKDINMRFKDVRQGLSHQTVNCFYQDEFGFLWIGTQDGLNRFDGRKFEVFKPDNANPYSININNIRQVCGNKAGLLFIRSLQSVTLYDMRLNRFRVLREGEVAGICYAHDALWIATGKEIYRYRNLDQAPELFFSFPSDEEDVLMNSLMVRQNQTVVVGTSSKGVYCIDQSAHITRRMDVGAVNSITEDRNGSIWIATRNRGLIRLDEDGTLTHFKHNKVAENTINHNNVRHVTQANDSLLYIGTYAGLQTLNLFTGEFTDYEYDLNVEAADIRSIISMHYDTSGTLWLGTFYQGIQYYNVANDAFHFYRSSTAVGGHLNSYIISSIAEDRSGRIWFASEGSGLNYYDKHTKRFSPLKKVYSQELSFKIVKSLYYEREPDYLWVASLYQGINRINLSTGHIESIPENIYTPEGKTVVDRAYNLVKMIEFAGHDSLLIAAKGGLLVLDKKHLRLHHFEHPSLAAKHLSQVWDMTFDKDGDLWPTTSFDLIRVNLKAGTAHSYPFSQIAQSTAQHHINHILCDKKGRIWLGSTGSGIYLFDKKTDSFVGYGAKQGLENGFITGLVESPLDGSIYVATNGGFSKFNLATTTFENYNRQSDFPLNNVNDGGLYIASDHDIYVCGLAGIVSIAQEKLNKQSVDYDVFVKRVLVDNTEIQPLDSLGLIKETVLYEHRLVLPPRYSSVTFEIASNTLNNISNIGLEYKLEGFDNEYMKAGDNTMITYTNLHPGHYTFHVRGDQVGVHGREAPSVSFELIVEAPVYQRAWFILLMVLAAILIAGYIIRMFWIRKTLRHSLLAEKREKEYIESVNQSKLRFFTNISHEFRTPLTLIVSQLEMLMERNDIQPLVYGKLVGIHRNTLRMKRLITELLDFRKQEQGFEKFKYSKQDIYSFLDEIYLSFKEYARGKQIIFEYFNKDRSLDVWFDVVQLEKVIYNLLSNAFKYTPLGGTVSLSVQEYENSVMILISDTGIGIAEENLNKIFDRFYQVDSLDNQKGTGIGLALAKSIIEAHKGKIGARSREGKGTTFVVELPLGDSHISVSQKVETPDIDSYCISLLKMDDEKITEEIPEDENSDRTEEPSSKILIVEDNEELRELLVRLFSKVYSVYEAQDGEEGFEKTKEVQPDIVLSDIMMPKMSGIEMCRMIKSNFETSHIPVILLTAQTAEEFTIQGLKMGADDYITKPFNVKHLFMRCNNLVNGRKLLQKKYAKQMDNNVDILATNGADQQFMEQCVICIEQNIDNPNFDVNMFAQALNIGRTKLFLKLKGITGQTPNDFILNVRLKKAQMLLIQSDTKTISEIAYEVGFNSPSYFIKRFRELFGITPAQFQKGITE